MYDFNMNHNIYENNKKNNGIICFNLYHFFSDIICIIN